MLVAYATKHSSTAEIAEHIAAAMREASAHEHVMFAGRVAPDPGTSASGRC